MTFQATREVRAGREGLLESGYEFDFGWGGIGDLFGALPTSASEGLIGSIWESIVNPDPVVISEVPEGWETVIIGGVERTRVPDVYQGPEPVLEPFDPNVVIGEVQGADTAEQEDEVVAHDWGHLVRQGIGALTGISDQSSGTQTFLPAGSSFVEGVALGGAGAVGAAAECDGMVWKGGAPPKGYKVVNYCGQGVLRKVRRRRRRRLLTRGDSQDIATIVGLVGKGQMASALINRRT